jgi:RNA polymerase sigma-70 factor, ECF subfamily
MAEKKDGPLDEPVEGRTASLRTSMRLLRRARQGDEQALDQLLGRNIPRLMRWASGRLPRWARTLADTADLVQESVVHSVRHIARFEPRHERALEIYLRRAVMNRIRDECRRAARRGAGQSLDDPGAEALADAGASPLETLIGREAAERYEAALHRLRTVEQQAIVARVELGYSYEQIALLLHKPSPDAARVAVTRALLRLAEGMERGT